MARAGSGTKFVSVNLNKSYGQPASATGAGAGASGLQGSGRSRLPGGMLLLTRPARAQPAAAAAAPPKVVKLTAPRPMNLPSLRREHAGNDPTIALVGGSGSSGWSKQQPPYLHVEETGAQSGSSIRGTPIDAPASLQRSVAFSVEPTRGSPVSSDSDRPVSRGASQNGDLRAQPYEKSVGRSGVYTPPAARIQANGSPAPMQVPLAPVEKAVVLRGEDFPTLQASLPSPSVPTRLRQKELQQKQREKQQELNEQHLKLQQLSQQQTHNFGSENPLSPQQSGPQLQPTHSMRPQVKPKPPASRNKDGPVRQETRLEQPNGTSRKTDSFFSGPPPLVKLNHTSNWADDERETFQTLRPQGMHQSDSTKWDRSRGESRPSEHRSMDQHDDFGYGRSFFLKSDSLGVYSRDDKDSQELFLDRDSVFGLNGGYGKDSDFSNSSFNETSSGRAGLSSREGIGSRDGSFARDVNFKPGWGSSKDSNPSRDAGFGNHNRQAVSSRDNVIVRESGYDRDTSMRSGNTNWDSGNGRGYSNLKEGLGRESNFRNGYSRGGGSGRETSYGNDGSNTRRTAGAQDGGHSRQGDRFGRPVGYQLEGPGNRGRTAFAGERGVQDLLGYDLARDKRSTLSFERPYREDSFFRDLSEIPGLELKSNLGFGGPFGLEIKIVRRKKDESRSNDMCDPERESFEAELERVQKMQEEERQRMLEERERAIELARQEQEEQERLAREEEELRRKQEEEAREAAAKAEREAVEAARKLEEERRAREEEKRRVIMEEERRKEAARKKLLELEERIAKREAEKRKEEGSSWHREEERVYGGNSVRDEEEEHGLREEPRKREDVDWEDHEHAISLNIGSEQDDDERAPLRLSRYLPTASMPREAVDEPLSRAKPLETGLRSSDSRAAHTISSDCSKSVPTWRRESVDNGYVPALSSVLTPPSLDGLHPTWQREHQQRGFSPRESFYGTARNLPRFSTQDKGPSDFSARMDHATSYPEQRWSPNEDVGFLAKYSPPDIDNGYYDAYDRDVDRRWGRDHRLKTREEHRLTSPPLASYLQRADAPESLPSGRLRQSLPKQPRVPPPPSRATLQKPPLKTDGEQYISAASVDDKPRTEVQIEIKSRPDSEEEELGEVEIAEHLSGNIDLSMQQDTLALQEAFMEPDIQAHFPELESHDAGPQTASVHSDELEDSIDSHLVEESEDQGALGMQESIEMDIPKVSSTARVEESVDDEEEDWVLEGEREDDLGEVEDENGFVMQNEGNNQGLENPGLGTSIIDMDDDEDVSEFLADDYEEVNVEEQIQEDRSEVDFDNGGQLERSLDVQSEDFVETEQEADVKVEVHADEPKEILEGSQDTLQQPTTQQFVQQGSFLSLNAIDSAQMGQTDLLNSRQSLAQQFQQPFSFMAVPLPHSNTSESTSGQPPVLASIAGLQNQPEMPFQLQFGLLPGTPLIPNAIQIGSIQMPLHLHPQMPQLAHLHGPQPPMFQFGQIGHSAPLSQPLAVVQPAVQIHHPTGQPLPLQPNQPQLMQQSEDAVHIGTKDLQQSSQLISQGENTAKNLNTPWIDQNGASETHDHVKTIEQVTRSAMKSDFESEKKSSMGELAVLGFPAHFKTARQSGQASQHAVASVSVGKEATAEREIVPPVVNSMAIGNIPGEEGSLQQSTGMLLGGRRKIGGIRVSGIPGRGRGRTHGASTNGYEAPSSTSETMWSEAGGERGFVRGRSGRRNFLRAEYRVRDSGEYKAQESLSSRDINFSDLSAANKQQTDQERIQFPGSDFRALGNNENVTISDSQRDSAAQVNSRTVGREGEQNSEVFPGLRPLQGGGKGDRQSSLKGLSKSTGAGMASASRSSEGISKKYGNSQAASDVPLQTGVVHVFEQPGIENPKDEDDFIEVRSKRQMMNDKREQREKESKAKSKDLKAKEQAVRKQLRLSAKTGQQNSISGKNSISETAERQSSLPGSSVEAVSSDVRLVQPGHSTLVCSTVAESCVTIPAQPLAPIGTPAGGSSDMTIDKRPKGSKSVQAKSSLAVTCNDPEILAASVQESHTCIQDNISNTSLAWGGQSSAHQVVSLTQIQLEEVMKPVRFEGSLSQHSTMAERGAMVLEPGVSMASMAVHEKTSAAVSGPIGSLFTGEQIQFGAFTSQTVLSPSSQPLSPASFVGVGGSLEVTELKNQARHLPGEDMEISFASKAKRARGDVGRLTEGIDPEAEAEAAASAVAVAAIGSDDSGGNMHHSEMRTVNLGGVALPTSRINFEENDSTAITSGVSTTRPVIVHAPIIEDSMAVALPADLSVETPSLILRNPPPNGQGSSGLMLPSLPSGAAPFPCLEMGAMLGGPIFALGPPEDASSLPQGSKPGPSLEPGLPATGPSGMSGWQLQHSGGVDSFYGGPHAGFTGPFIGPAGGIPSIQGPQHMLVYTNPFASVRQFGQLGVSFMSAYVPSGKQPDWKHTPLTTSSTGGSGLVDGDLAAGLAGMRATQHSSSIPNPVQRMAPGTSSVMPIASPLGLFDINLSGPFQISSADVPGQSQWSHLPGVPLHSVQMSGPVMGLSMQQGLSGCPPCQIGNLPHIVEASSGFHSMPVSKPVASSPYPSVDAAAQFPDELGLGDMLSGNTSSLLGGGQRPPSRGHASNTASPGTPGPSLGNKAERGRRPSRSRAGNTGLAGAIGSKGGNSVLGTSSGLSDGQGTSGILSGSSHFQSQNIGQPASVGHSHSGGYTDQRIPSQQGPTRISLGNEWSSGPRKGVTGRSFMAERGPAGERGGASSAKLKQVYVAKHVVPPQKLGTAVNDCETNIFHSQEVTRTAIGC